IDICEIARIRSSLERFGIAFFERILTEQERAYCERHADSAVNYAGRFAAKEAAIKALGGPPGLRWHDMEILRTEGGAPRLALHGATAEIAKGMGVTRTHLSISHDGGFAAAVVILEATST